MSNVERWMLQLWASTEIFEMKGRSWKLHWSSDFQNPNGQESSAELGNTLAGDAALVKINWLLQSSRRQLVTEEQQLKNSN